MKFSVAALVSLMAYSASAVDLTSDNYDSLTDGKIVFIKHFAPWCGHCKAMKPDWDKLMEEFKDDETKLIADIDCTSDKGKPLCDAHGVKGFPTIMYGDASDLQDYQGQRSYDALKSFAETELKPMCGPNNLDLCDDKKKAEIKEFFDMSDADLQAKIAVEENKIEVAEAKMKSEIEKLQNQYQILVAQKDAVEAAVKADGLGLMKSVQKIKAKTAGSDEL